MIAGHNQHHLLALLTSKSSAAQRQRCQMAIMITIILTMFNAPLWQQIIASATTRSVGSGPVLIKLGLQYLQHAA